MFFHCKLRFDDITSQLLTDPDMLSLTGDWFCNGCTLEADSESYDGVGFIVRSRSKVWAGLTQDFDISNGITAGDSVTMIYGFHMQLLNPAETDVVVTPKLRLVFADGSKFFMTFATYTIAQSMNTGWHELSETRTFSVRLLLIRIYNILESRIVSTCIPCGHLLKIKNPTDDFV